MFNKLNSIYDNLKNYNLVTLKRISNVYSGKEVVDEIKKSSSSFEVYGSGPTAFKYTSNYLFDGKYIIFGRKGTIGKPYILDKKFWLVDTAYAITNNKKVSFDYLYYILRIFKWEIFTTNTVKPSVVADEIIKTKVKLPTIKIQKNINKKINMLENKIKMYKSLVNQQIQNLQELKLTLISDVVTG
ncbi:restriction endonuclease subunit S, partial [Gemella sp. zg-1178]|uniref:restriction endonuclease subunit S n=1 Tax=Gemella sp. zg-1178 TaxID=2840372 RepID=UPI001C055FDC